MKRFIPILLLLLGCGTACTGMLEDTDRDSRSDSNIVFYATLEDAGLQQKTKVYTDTDLKVRWNADDRISLFNKRTGNEEYRFDGANGDDAGNFSRVGDEKPGNSLSHVYAVYPYSSSTTIDSQGAISLIMPSEQTYQQNSFGLGFNTMVSVTDDDHLQFKNVGGYLAIKLYGAGYSVSSITLKGNKGEKLAGDATVTIQPGETPSVSMATSATDMVTLVCNTPVPLNAGSSKYTTFWFVIPPTDFTEGFTVTITTDGGETFEKSTTKSITVSRNTLIRMASLELAKEGIFNYEYGDDSNWDHSDDFGGSINSNGYNGDCSWDSTVDGNAELGKDNYGNDSNWDSNGSDNTTIGQEGYGDDTNLDSNENSTGNIEKDGYGDDANLDPNNEGNADIDKEGYGDDNNWDPDGDSSGSIEKDGYGEDKNWD